MDCLAKEFLEWADSSPDNKCDPCPYDEDGSCKYPGECPWWGMHALLESLRRKDKYND